MKKINHLIIISLLLLILSYSTVVYAQENYNSFDVISISDTSYTFNCIVRNHSTGAPLENIAYVNQPLKNFDFWTSPLKNNAFINGSLKWENPDYTIVKGGQFVNAIFTDYATTEIVTIKIYIKGLDIPLKKIHSSNNDPYWKIIYTLRIGDDINEQLPVLTFRANDCDSVKGITIIGDSTQLSLGYHEIPWSFTPDDSSYEIKSGVIKVNVIPLKDYSDEPTSLAVNSVLLESPSTTYDLNLTDKVVGSTYVWTSSDTSVATVNSKNGLVTAKKNGNAKITCEVTTPDNNTSTLVADVTVGLDDNATILSDSELDLEIGDKTDIDVENKISKATYKWRTSDKKVVKVNSSNGKVEAIGKGSANVTCTITTPNKQVIVLSCKVNVE